jgi:hypothetical protein
MSYMRITLALIALGLAAMRRRRVAGESGIAGR